MTTPEPLKLPVVRDGPPCDRSLADWFVDAPGAVTGEFVHGVVDRMREQEVDWVIAYLRRWATQVEMALTLLRGQQEVNCDTSLTVESVYGLRAVVGWVTTLLAQMHRPTAGGLCDDCHQSWPCHTVHTITTAMRTIVQEAPDQLDSDSSPRQRLVMS
jgi:hypothetical protein